MPILSRTFYLFSGIHSFLLGLLPIFIPVILWDKGLTVADIAWFVALSALGFLMALSVWDRLRAKANWSLILGLSFALQMLLVSLLVWDSQPFLLSVGALINGAAGCFYWSTQRFLFQAITEDNNTGNTFGNFQILVVFSLKIGVLVGSYLLDIGLFGGVLVLSFSLSLVGFYWVNKSLLGNPLYTLKQVPPFSFKQILAFKDSYHSKLIFVIDGLFLFLESYFWVLTIYMLTQENVMQLGIILVGLSVLLAFIFFVIKKYIDRVNPQRIYYFAVIGYALSWLLRGEFHQDMETLTLYSGLLVVAFLSNFFRLAFNKRFYDIARKGKATAYIICKSYYSQFMLMVFFGAIALVVSMNGSPLNQLQTLYYLSTPLALLYFLYGNKKKVNRSI